MVRILLVAALALAPAAHAQNSLESSGNGLLQGSYNFRQVYWLIDREGGAGNLRRQVALTGTIQFDGAGSYTVRADVMDSTSNRVESINSSGGYNITASGFGFIDNPDPDRKSGVVWGLVSQGVFVGSSTELPRNDLFIAAPATPALTASSFSGNYWAAEVNFPGASVNQARDALFQLNPDGRGGLATVNATGYIGSGSRTTQTVTNARYTVDSGVATLSFGGTLSNQNLLAGDRVVFFSPDGNFFFGGSNNGWNMLVGVRAVAGSAPAALVNGLYYTAGVDLDTTASGPPQISSYYGTVSSADGNLLAHQRLYSGFDDLPYDFTYSDVYALAPDGSYEDYTGVRHISGAGGAYQIGFGQQGVPGINVALRAPAFTGPGVFLNPAGVVNSASRAPFTAGLARGTMIELTGTNLAAETASDELFPNTLSGVQVFINDRMAPVRSVSPSKIVALVPFDADNILRIRVNNNGVDSNVVTMFRSDTSPGVFTVPPGGTGYAQAFHADSTPVNPASPAKPGEKITVRVTGLGAVDQSVADGAPGPSDPPARSLNRIELSVSVNNAEVEFAGLAPGLRGIYQITFTVPMNSRNGDLFVNVSTADAFTSQAQIPVAAAGRDTAREAGTRSGRPRSRPRRPGDSASRDGSVRMR